MYALVDCNNFYASCERIFNPRLENKPIVVMSNNDGCAIARSEEAKALGIEMGTPIFLINDLVKKHGVNVFSSNYTLYGDMSDRVMKTLAGFVHRLEIYSIDEAFLDMHDRDYTDLLKLGMTIHNTVRQNTGIPVCVGIAPTKTLAKMANRFAKKKRMKPGVFWAANTDLVNEMLAFTEVRNIWGVGKQHAEFLEKNGFKTAMDLVKAPDEWIRKNMSVVGQRLLNELRGIPAIELEFEPELKKNICTSRSFGSLQTDKSIIKEAICNYTANCAMKLRRQKSCARMINVFVQTNPHRTEDEQYYQSINVQLEKASNDTPELIRHALKGFDIIFKNGINYQKAGVIVMDFVPEEQVQLNMFSENNPKLQKAMSALDLVNKSLGKDVVRFAVQGYEKKYRLRTGHLSPCYTTNINHIIKVRI